MFAYFLLRVMKVALTPFKFPLAPRPTFPVVFYLYCSTSVIGHWTPGYAHRLTREDVFGVT